MSLLLTIFLHYIRYTDLSILYQDHKLNSEDDDGGHEIDGHGVVGYGQFDCERALYELVEHEIPDYEQTDHE